MTRPFDVLPVDYSAGFSFLAMSLTSLIAFSTSVMSLQAANLSATRFKITSICLSVIFSSMFLLSPFRVIIRFSSLQLYYTSFLYFVNHFLYFL
nr:MAG TPA: hypothetical protein [Caudoviricetes sp.]